MIATETKTLRTALVAAVLVSAGLAAVYYNGGVAGHADDTPLRASLVGAAGALIAGLITWRALRGAYADPARLARWSPALIAVSVVSLAGFWIGITIPVCAGAAAAGRRCHSRAVVAVAAVVIVASLVLSVLGES